MGLSVIIPVYNGDVHLKTCLFFVLNSSLKDIGIIIVDDASKDNSLKILKGYDLLLFCYNWIKKWFYRKNVEEEDIILLEKNTNTLVYEVLIIWI